LQKPVDEQDFNNRFSHQIFFETRDWTCISSFWSRVLRLEVLPDFIFVKEEIKEINDGFYGVTDLFKIHQLGLNEFSGMNPRYKRQSFAMRIGYNGSHYQGFQLQGLHSGIRTVEGDLREALGGKPFAVAGRTDKDVSAVSQIISFSTYEEIYAEMLIANFKSSFPYEQNQIHLHSLFSVGML